MIIQSIDLNMIPESAPVVVHVNQYDVGEDRIVATLYDGSQLYTPASGATAVIQGMKPDGKGFDYDATLSGSTVTANLTEQMTAVEGNTRCQIVISEGDNVTGTFVFNLIVQKSALPADADMSKSEYSVVMQLIEQAEAISVNVPYIGANGNWWVYSVQEEAYIDTGVDASISVSIADITMLDPSATPYVTNSGTDTDPIFHLFIPRGKGISSITKTGTQGLVDTYTITYSDGATTTFNVTNGANGTDGDDGRGIDNITKHSSTGLVDHYIIWYSDGTTSTFNVTNGADGTDGVSVTGVSLLSKVGLLATYRMTFSNGTYFDYTVSDGSSGSGAGDMTKAVYDTNNNGIVDAAETLQGLVASIADLNKTASLATVATTGAYSDLTGKPNLATVATSGSYNDLSNKPTIPAAQVNSDWNASSGVAQILNKPTIPAAQVNADWNATSGLAQILNKPNLATVATSGSYNDLSNRPTIPTVYNETLTIQQNGTNKATFTANSSTAATANIVTDEWTSTATVNSSGQVTFSGLSDSYGYDLYCQNKLVGISAMTKSGSGSSVSITYTLTGAASGDVCKLRILK